MFPLLFTKVWQNYLSFSTVKPPYLWKCMVSECLFYRQLLLIAGVDPVQDMQRFKSDGSEQSELNDVLI